MQNFFIWTTKTLIRLLGAYVRGTFSHVVVHFLLKTDQEFLSYFTSEKTFKHPNNGSTFLSPSNVVLPGNIDWRKEGYVTPVKNQGHCGSCWSFSATGSIEGQHFKATGRLVSLSEQQLVDCSGSFGNQGCKQGLPDNAFKYIQASGGLEAEEVYPYQAKVEKCRFNKSQVEAKVTSFVDVKRDSESGLKAAVAKVGPVSVVIDASQTSFRFYGGGIYDEKNCSSRVLDHSVLVVGYGTAAEEDYWLVKNSWGKSWGEEGYIQMSRNKDNQCGIATLASYPIV